MARKPFLLLGTPNSGTDWFAECILAATSWRYFRKEFFNPLTNAAQTGALLTAFGCELITGVRHLATCEHEKINAAVSRTWPAGMYDFNKEVWSFAKLPALIAHFDCLVLSRSTVTLFPPSRLRVWQWYDAIWHSLHLAGHSLAATAPRERAIEAHRCVNAMLAHSAVTLKVPQLDYDHLVTAAPEEIAQLCAALADHWPVDAEKLCHAILATRRGKKVLEPPARRG